MLNASNGPKVSIIMGVYNSSEVVGRAIESILSQSYQDFEFIICDDQSTDNTFEVVKKYCLKDKRVKVIKNKLNVGLAETLNNCIRISNGIYIARMDDDDISHVDRIKKQVQFMLDNPEYAVVGTSKRFFDNDGIWGKSIISGERSTKDIYKGLTFTHPSVIMRKEALDSVDWYTVSPLTRRGQDFDLWCKLYYAGFKGYNMKDILLDYYESKNSVKRRKLKFRVTIFKSKMYWKKKLKLPFYYYLYAYKELVAGFIPKKALLGYRKFKNKKSLDIEKD